MKQCDFALYIFILAVLLGFEGLCTSFLLFNRSWVVDRYLGKERSCWMLHHHLQELKVSCHSIGSGACHGLFLWRKKCSLIKSCETYLKKKKKRRKEKKKNPVMWKCDIHKKCLITSRLAREMARLNNCLGWWGCLGVILAAAMFEGVQQ